MGLLGADGSGQASAARYLAARFGRSLLTVDLAATTAAGTAPARAVAMALRDSLLTGAVPYLAGWEAVTAGDHGLSRRRSPCSATFPGPAIVGSRSAWQPSGLDRQRVFLQIEVSIPDFDHRAALVAAPSRRAGG